MLCAICSSVIGPRSWRHRRNVSSFSAAASASIRRSRKNHTAVSSSTGGQPSLRSSAARTAARPAASSSALPEAFTTVSPTVSSSAAPSATDPPGRRCGNRGAGRARDREPPAARLCRRRRGNAARRRGARRGPAARQCRSGRPARGRGSRPGRARARARRAASRARGANDRAARARSEDAAPNASADRADGAGLGRSLARRPRGAAVAGVNRPSVTRETRASGRSPNLRRRFGGDERTAELLCPFVMSAERHPK